MMCFAPLKFLLLLWSLCSQCIWSLAADAKKWRNDRSVNLGHSELLKPHQQKYDSILPYITIYYICCQVYPSLSWFNEQFYTQNGLWTSTSKSWHFLTHPGKWPAWGGGTSMLPGDGGVVVGTGLCGQPGSDAGLCWALEAMVAMVAVAIVAFVCICIYAIWKIWNSDQ